MMYFTTLNVATSSSTFEDVNMHSNLNFSNGLTQHFVKKNIIKKQDREKALEGIKKDKELGINLIDSLNKTKRVTTSSLIQRGLYIVGKEVLEVVKDRINLKR
jgi:methionine-rich copper-binding protein CopC